MTPRWPPDDLRRPVWPPYGDYPLPSAEEALQASLRAFPSWFLKIECDRCGKVRMLNEVHATAGQRNMRPLPQRSHTMCRNHDGKARRDAWRASSGVGRGSLP